MSLVNDNNKSKDHFKNKRQKRKERKEGNLLKKFKKDESESINTETVDTEQEEVISPSTISIAVPGSILENAQSPELRTYLAGQIARAACIFQVDEVIVFDDYGETFDTKKSKLQGADGVSTARHCCVQLARILQYLECPQYLRKYFFPIHQDLKYVGILNPLDAPHHLRQDNDFVFREGVVTNKPVGTGKGSFVNIGLLKDVIVDKILTPGLRVTVKLQPQEGETKKLRGVVVSPNAPRTETGVYWGYTVRIAKSLSQVFSQSPYPEGYDLTIGTSDKGTLVDSASSLSFQHALVVFGGLKGLEAALESDEVFKTDDPSELFDHYFNTLPNQGSRTIRTEEAIIVTMAALRTKLVPKNEAKSFVSDVSVDVQE